MARPFVAQFGFDVVTCCGYLPQVSDRLFGFDFLDLAHLKISGEKKALS